MRLAPGQIEVVLGKLQGVRKTGENQWLALCPCHDDQEPSLSVGIGDDQQLLLHCFSGCPWEATAAEVGLLNGGGPSANGSRRPPKSHRGGRRGRRWRLPQLR